MASDFWHYVQANTGNEFYVMGQYLCTALKRNHCKGTQLHCYVTGYTKAICARWELAACCAWRLGPRQKHGRNAATKGVRYFPPVLQLTANWSAHPITVPYHVPVKFTSKPFTIYKTTIISNKLTNQMQQSLQFITWSLFTAQHVSGVFTPIIRSSTTAVATSGCTVGTWW